MFKNPFVTRNIPFLAILVTLEIILQVIGNYIALGPVSINLSLIIIALGAILFGPWGGALLGVINALFIFVSPYTMVFFEASVPGTILTVLIKSTTAGFVSGIIYQLFKNKSNPLATILASLSIPLINTGLFICGSLLFFQDYIKSITPEGQNFIFFLFIGMTGWNFIFEVVSTSLLTYPLYRLSDYYRNKISPAN